VIDRQRIITLLKRLPMPAESSLAPGASNEAIELFSRRTGIVLPEDVREWLRLTNAPLVGYCALLGIGVEDGIEEILDRYPEWKQRYWLPIATDGCGNYYVVPTKRDFGEGFPVLFIDTMADRNSPAYIVASDIGRFLLFFFEDQLKDHSLTFNTESWPFNKEQVTKEDPAIVKFKNVRLPWECD